MWLDKCLTNHASEHRSTVKMLKGLKDRWNLEDSTFIKFIDHSEENRVRKCLS